MPGRSTNSSSRTTPPRAVVDIGPSCTSGCSSPLSSRPSGVRVRLSRPRLWRTPRVRSPATIVKCARGRTSCVTAPSRATNATAGLMHHVLGVVVALDRGGEAAVRQHHQRLRLEPGDGLGGQPRPGRRNVNRTGVHRERGTERDVHPGQAGLHGLVAGAPPTARSADRRPAPTGCRSAGRPAPPARRRDRPPSPAAAACRARPSPAAVRGAARRAGRGQTAPPRPADTPPANGAMLDGAFFLETLTMNPMRALCLSLALLALSSPALAQNAATAAVKTQFGMISGVHGQDRREDSRGALRLQGYAGSALDGTAHRPHRRQPVHDVRRRRSARSPRRAASRRA